MPCQHKLIDHSFNQLVALGLDAAEDVGSDDDDRCPMLLPIMSPRCNRLHFLPLPWITTGV
jgi:hypothetical protein